MANGYTDIPSPFGNDSLAGTLVQYNTVTTTDDSLTLLESDNLVDHNIYDVGWTVVAQRTDMAGRAAYKRLIRAYRDGAGAVIGSTDILGTDYDPSTFGGLTIDATGNILRLRVSGLPVVQAELVDQDITYTAVPIGALGNSITAEYVGDGTAGAETVGVVGQAVTVHMDPTAVTGSTATQIVAALDAFELANPGVLSALVTYSVTGVGANVQNSHAATPLAGGETPTIDWKVASQITRVG